MKRSARIPRATRIRVCLCVGLIGSSTVYAETWRIVPAITVNETLTDNVSLAADDRKQSDLITQITPSIRIDGTGSRVRLNLNYRMTNILYANESDRNRTQNYLNAVGRLEAVENWLFIDANAAITQQSISAFGAQPNTENINANRAQTSTYQVSPYITGRLGTAADYQLRYRWTTTHAGTGQFSDTQVEDWIGTLKGVTGLRTLSWALDAHHQVVNRDVGPDPESDRAGASLIYQVDPQIRLTVRGGYESNNYSSQRRSSKNYGGGVDWSPTERTQLTAFQEKRFFGDSRTISFRHRTRLTAWQYSDRKSVSVLPNQLAIPAPGVAFDLLFNALESRIPDPVERAQEVERLLAQGGIPPDLALASGFLTTRVTLQRSRQGSVAILGVQNTLTLAVGETESETLGVGAGVGVDDFSATPSVQQRSISAALSHRMSPLSSLSLLASQIRSSATSGSAIDSTQRTVRLLFTRRMGPKTTGTIGARFVDFESSSSPGYSEKALTAALSVTF